jgi:hypothetical protein
MHRHRTSIVIVVAALLLAGTAPAQDFGFRGGGPRGPFHAMPNAKYDGRFTFVRLNYQTAPGGYWYGGWPAWAHGYPLAEQNLMRIMNEISLLGARADEINTVALDDPELFQYPIAYIIEVGWWTLRESEAAALRAYLLKGGFVIVDDFKIQGFGGGFGNGGGGWPVFEQNMNRVLPGVRFFEMDASHPIYHAFFEIGSLDIVPQAYNAGRPIFRGVYEDNDPTKRLMMIVNYNTDISQFWEWSGTGLRPIDDTNEAYKLGVNYVMYGMTH